ncbi:MAG: IS200/IS605 family transposase [Candidatus Marinimicrobia bacterium]|nr:IS200/IS605 family transposase [Candidatus Neomarinimicrobiota bacterium]
MSHSLPRVWIHGVFGTKYRQPLLKDDIREDLMRHIRVEMEKMGCGVRCINGTPDHIHVLFLLPRNLSLAQVMKSVKGESSRWMNQNKTVLGNFSWQVGYGVFSVSESAVKRVERYI